MRVLSLLRRVITPEGEPAGWATVQEWECAACNRVNQGQRRCPCMNEHGGMTHKEAADMYARNSERYQSQRNRHLAAARRLEQGWRATAATFPSDWNEPRAVLVMCADQLAALVADEEGE